MSHKNYSGLDHSLSLEQCLGLLEQEVTDANVAAIKADSWQRPEFQSDSSTATFTPATFAPASPTTIWHDVGGDQDDEEENNNDDENDDDDCCELVYATTPALKTPPRKEERKMQSMDHLPELLQESVLVTPPISNKVAQHPPAIPRLPSLERTPSEDWGRILGVERPLRCCDLSFPFEEFFDKVGNLCDKRKRENVPLESNDSDQDEMDLANSSDDDEVENYHPIASATTATTTVPLTPANPLGLRRRRQRATTTATALSGEKAPMRKQRQKSCQLQVSKRVYVSVITDSDVLFGRGGKTNHHPGNVQFRALAEATKPRYFACATKPEKKGISLELVDHVHRQSGRFLVEDEDGRYYIAAPNVARKKASQCLREQKKRSKVLHG